MKSTLTLLLALIALIASPSSIYAKVSENNYEALPVTAEERHKISMILITMAENNVVQLLFEKRQLERWGDEVNHVHPIRFIGTAFSNPRLAHCMKKIYRSTFKWNGFINGFSNRILEEVAANNVDKYLPSFCEMLGVSLEAIQGYVDARDFEGMVVYLIKHKR